MADKPSDPKNTSMADPGGAGPSPQTEDAYLVRLKARGLVEFSGRGTVRASEELFS